MNDSTVLWRVFPNTTVSVSATEGSNAPGALRFEFYPNPALALLGGQQISGTLRSFEYNRRDGISNFDFSVNNEATNNGNGLPILIRHFIPQSLGALLSGNPFLSTGSLEKCSDAEGNKCIPAQPFVSRVEYAVGNLNPLHIRVRSGTVIDLGTTDQPLNLHGALTLAAPADIVLEHLAFDTVEQRVDGALANGAFSLGASQLSMNGFSFVIASGRFSFDSLTFSGGGDHQGRVQLQNCALQFTLNQRSAVRFAGTSNDGLELDFSSGATVSASGAFMSLDDRTGSEFTATSLAALGDVAGGELALGRKGFLGISSGHVALSLQRAAWSSNGVPTAEGTLAGSLAFRGGKLFLRPDSGAEVQGGTILPFSLHLDTSSNPPVTGTFPGLTLSFAPNSEVVIPGGLWLRLKDGSQIASTSTASPITVSTGSDFPFGAYSLDLVFDALMNSPNGTLTLRSGHASLPLSVTQVGQVSGQGIHGDGVLKLSQSAATQDIALNFTNGTLQQAAPTSPQQGSFPITGTTSFATPQTTIIPGHRTDKGDERFFPVTIVTAIKDPFTFNGTITLDGKIQASGYTTVTLTVPPGGGEYIDRDHPERGTKGGNDPKDHCQEFWQDQFTQGIGHCTKHLYLTPRDYKIRGLLDLQMANGTMQGKMPSPSVPSIDMIGDGCSFGLGEILSIVGTLPVEIGTPFAAGKFLGEWHNIQH